LIDRKRRGGAHGAPSTLPRIRLWPLFRHAGASQML
jgi:hypothetical protein